MGAAQLGVAGDWTELQPPDDDKATLDFPSDDPDAYSVQIMGDVLHPRIKSGELVIMEPGHEVIPGDEVLIGLLDGRTMLRELAWIRDGQHAFNGIVVAHARLTLLSSTINYVHYIVGIVKPSRLRPL